MKRVISLVAFVGLQALGCAALPTLTERPEDYHLYRASRVAPTLEERLQAADRYLKQKPTGPRAEELRRWFVGAEEKYYLQAFDRLPNLHAYRAALPDGPHIAEVEARIDALEARRARRAARQSDEDARAQATERRLRDADASRRAFVATFKDWTARLLRVETYGQPTSELPDETIFAFRLSEPRGACQVDSCRKLLRLPYEAPGARELVPREALLEVQLDLSRGLLERTRLAGPELWTRLAEALSLRALPSPSPAERADAVNRSSFLVRALLEPVLPASECEKPAAPPVVLLRQCRGRSARMVAAPTRAEDDVLEIAPLAP